MNIYSVLLCCFSFLFESSAFVSLVAPLLFKRSVDSDFFESVELQSGNGFDSFNEWWKSVDYGNCADFLGLFRGVIETSVFSFGDWLLFVSGEQNQFINVVLKSVFIEFQRLLASVFSSVVNADSNGSGELNSESCGFDFSQSESWNYGNGYLCRF